MKINSEIQTTLMEAGIYAEDGIAYLLCRYFYVQSDVFPKELVDRVLALNIVNEDNAWRIPLFDNPGTDPKWDWVSEEYVSLFAPINKATNKREATARMKRLFASNPDIRKDEVIGATEMYLFNTNSKFVRLPHYFIEKGVGNNKTSDILTWIDKYRLTQESEVRDNSRMLQ